MALYDYQGKALADVVARLKSTPRTLLVMPTGTGKTRVAAHYAKDLVPKGRGLVLCHDTNILAQNLQTFREVLGETVSLGMFHGQQKDYEEVDILFATFQTFLTWKEAFFKNEFHFIIVDEAHHGAADTYRLVIEYFTPAQLLGMTATPDRMDERDIREIFGDEAVHITLEQAIANGWLTPVEYHVHTDGIDTRMVKALLRRAQQGDRTISVKQLNETIFVRKRDAEIAWIIAGDNLRTLIFCESVRYTEIFVTHLPGAVTFHSDNRPDDNDEALAGFRRGDAQYIASVNKFNEGIDVPDVEEVAFLRCTDSLTIFLQQLGRGLRLMPGKDKVIVRDFVGNCERLIMVQQMVENIAKAAGQDVELDREHFVIEGHGFSFSFSDEVRDIFEIIRLVKHKLYISDIPHLLAEYSDRNELPADEVRVGTNKKFQWMCATCRYQWEATAANRVGRRSGCPACAGHVATSTNCLAVTHPELAKEFHPTRNSPLTPSDIVAGTGKKLWWKCKKCEHEWETRGSQRKKGRGCPPCGIKKAAETRRKRRKA